MSNTSIAPGAGATALAGAAPAISIVANPIITRLEGGACLFAQWLGMTAGIVGAPLVGRRYNSASMQVEGTFGTAGSVQMEGSNDGAAFHKLSPSAVTSAGFIGPLEANEQARCLRPNCTAGDGTTSLNVSAWLVE